MILCILLGYHLILKYWEVQIHESFWYNNIIKIVDMANSKLGFPKCTFASVYNNVKLGNHVFESAISSINHYVIKIQMFNGLYSSIYWD